MKRLISMVISIALVATSLLASVSMTATAEVVTLEKIKVACVGDSITGGQANYNYPMYLQTMLGDEYEVANFGKGGAAVRKVLENVDGNEDGVINEGGEYFWYDSKQYTSSLTYDADIVFVMMGTNDALFSNFAYIDDYYKTDYKAMIQPYIDAGSEVILATSPYAYSIFLSDTDNLNVYIRQLQFEIAEEMGLEIIDVNTATANRNESFPDGLHGNTSGYMIIAETIYKEYFGGEVYTLTAETGEAATVTLSDDNDATGDYIFKTDANGHGTIPVLPGIYDADIKCGVYNSTVEDIVITGDMSYTFEFNMNNINYAIGATAVSDSEHAEYTQHTTELVNDGNDLTRWQPNSQGTADDPSWIYLDFGEAITFDTVTILWETARSSLNGYTLEYSDDAENWTVIEDERTRDTLVDPQIDTCLFEAVTARYLRVYCTENDGDKYTNPSIWELEVYNIRNQGDDTNPDPTPAGKGDVNGDGQINSTDYTQVRRHFLGTFTIAEENLDAADVDSDGQINGTDFMRIRRHFLGTFVIGE